MLSRRRWYNGRGFRRSGALGLPKESDERAPSFEVALVEGSNEVFKPSDLRFHNGLAS